MSGSERFDPPRKNGVYLINIEDAWDGYIAKGLSESHAVVEGVAINGKHLSLSGTIETECDDFELNDDGVLNLEYNDTGGEGCD